VVDLSFAKKLQNLSNDYYNQLISREDYVMQRKEILDALDSKYNSTGKADESDESSESLFMNTISFLNRGKES